MDLALRKLTSLLQLHSCNQERIMNVEQSRELHQLFDLERENATVGKITKPFRFHP